MSISAGLAEGLADLRLQAESMMTMTGTINAPGKRQYDPVTKRETYVPGPVIYTGPMRLRAAPSVFAVQAAGQQVTTQTYAGFVPWQVTGIGPDCTVIAATGQDAHLIGRMLTITTVEAHEPAVHRKFAAIDNLG